MKLITPQWPLPPGVAACSSTRHGGVSLPPYDALNLGAHCGDNPEHVEENRRRFYEAANFPGAPVWLEQVHGKEVLHLTGGPYASKRADASYTRERGTVCAVMTADCLPVLFCDASGREVAAAHAGWRGLCEGVLEETVACFQAEPATIQAWLGPAIGPAAFEVGRKCARPLSPETSRPLTRFVRMVRNISPIFTAWPASVWRTPASPLSMAASTAR